MMSVEPTVTYSIKEILDRIEGKVDKYFADHGDKFEKLELRLLVVETEHAKRGALRESLKYLIGAASAVAAAVAAIWVAVHP